MNFEKLLSKRVTIFLFLAAFAAFAAACGAVGEASLSRIDTKEEVPPPADRTSSEGLKDGFRAELKSEPGQIEAGKEATLVFTVRDKSDAVVKDLQIVHEKPMHLLVVSKDLAEFYHIHPEPQEDGSYLVKHTFPNGGDYRLYADFTPRDAKQVVEKIDVKVSGKERERVALTPDAKFEKTVDSLRVAMKPDGELKAGGEVMLEFAAFDAKSNKPATDLENYLGELAHFVIISEDMQDFVHAHPMSKDEHKSAKKTDASTVEMSDGDHNADGHTHDEKSDAKIESRSEVAAHTAFPRSGKYKIWAQFQRGGRVITVPFVVNVGGSEQKAAIRPAKIPADAFQITIGKNGYEPSEIKFEKGKPVKIAFYRSDAENCGGEVVFPKLNIRKKLPVGETVLVEFTPREAGEIAFSCGMDMMKGKILVQ